MTGPKAKAMDDRTLEALKGSIAKWEAIVAGSGGDKGQMDCPLCSLFIADNCDGCPVATVAGDTSCANTPFDQWRRSDRKRTEDGYFANTDCSRAAAQAELDFLRSLLPARATAAMGRKRGRRTLTTTPARTEQGD